MPLAHTSSEHQQQKSEKLNWALLLIIDPPRADFNPMQIHLFANPMLNK